MKIIILLILSMISLVLLPIFLSAILRLIGNKNKKYLVMNYGVWSQNTFCGLGVIVHELSHLIIALLFGHKVYSWHDIKLLDLHRPQQGKSMGYIHHYYDKRSIYQKLGNFFIGIAPCFGTSLFLLLIHYLFWGSESFNFSNVTNLKSVFITALGNACNPMGTFGLKWFIFVILVVMTAGTGYGLSKQDWHISMKSIPYWIVIIIVIDGLSLMFSPIYNLFIHLLWIIMLILLTFLSWGIVYSLITFIALYSVHKLCLWIK